MVEASPQRANMGFIGAIVAVATIGGFLFGYDSGAVNGTQDGLTQAFGLVPGSWSPTNGLGFTVASLLIGCFIGAFFAGRLADIMGRRNTLMVAAALFLVGALVQGFSHVAHRLRHRADLRRNGGGRGKRALAGLHFRSRAGGNPRPTDDRAADHDHHRPHRRLRRQLLPCRRAPAYRRRRFWLGLEAWRWMFLMQALPAAIFLVALFFIPESPRYLVSKGRDEQATSVLTRLFGSDVARAKLEEIRGTFSADHRPRLSRRSHARRRPGFLGVRQIVWVGIMLAVFQQLVGINVIFYYGATLWQLAGFTEDQSLLINIVSGAVSIAACFVTIAVIDKIGRKPLLLIGSAGMAVTLFAMVYAFSHGSLDPQGNLVLSQGSRHGRRRRRQPLRHLLQRQLGPGDVGDAGRDVPEPDPRIGARRLRLLPVVRELPDLVQLPGHGGRSSG